MSEGDTPEILDAWPTETGFTSDNFSLASEDNDPTAP